ncbi:MBL fold metallo-hydrolase [candidate division KSB1 bacterium]|nr:MBL fold metallo-hydrolase [candidate division KSB1 bacterium]
MRLTILGSGSGGNAAVIQNNGSSILVDSGFSYKLLNSKLKICGIPPESFSAMLITHEHEDHAKGLGAFSRIHRVPVYINETTYKGLMRITRKDIDANVNFFETGDVLDINGIEIKSFPVLHDAAEPVGFSFTSGNKKISYVTDIGSITEQVVDNLKNSSVAVIEANHDVEMLLNGFYPAFLKNRIKGPTGHLSNDDALKLIQLIRCEELQVVYLTHLSKKNNKPEVAYKKIFGPLAESGKHVPEIRIANQDEVSEPYNL